MMTSSVRVLFLFIGIVDASRFDVQNVMDALAQDEEQIDATSDGGQHQEGTNPNPETLDFCNSYVTKEWLGLGYSHSLYGGIVSGKSDSRGDSACRFVIESPGVENNEGSIKTVLEAAMEYFGHSQTGDGQWGLHWKRTTCQNGPLGTETCCVMREDWRVPVEDHPTAEDLQLVYVTKAASGECSKQKDISTGGPQASQGVAEPTRVRYGPGPSHSQWSRRLSSDVVQEFAEGDAVKIRSNFNVTAWKIESMEGEVVELRDGHNKSVRVKFPGGVKKWVKPKMIKKTV